MVFYFVISLERMAYCSAFPFIWCMDGWMSISTPKIRFISHIHSAHSLYVFCASATNIYYLFSSVNLFTMLAYNPKSFLSNVFIHFYCFIFHVWVRVVVRVLEWAVSVCVCVQIMDNKNKKENDEEAQTNIKKTRSSRAKTSQKHQMHGVIYSNFALFNSLCFVLIQLHLDSLFSKWH